MNSLLALQFSWPRPSVTAPLAFFGCLAVGGVALAGGALSERDRLFLEQAAQSGYADLSASGHAVMKARNARVRAFAQRKIDDHFGLGDDLRKLAASKNMTLPLEASVIQKGKEKLINGMSEEYFDRRFVLQMAVQANENKLASFERAALETRDPEVKAFAEKHLPMLRKHVTAAHELKAGVEPVTPPKARRYGFLR